MSDTRKQTRRRILVDPRFQYQSMRVCLYVGLMILGVAIVFYAAARLFLESHNVDPIVLRAMTGMALFIILFSALVGVVMVRMTHRVSGAALNLDRAIQRMMDGDYKTKIQLRKDDYLQNLADSLNDLRAEMERKYEGAQADQDVVK